jgi:hypothetical protein
MVGWLEGIVRPKIVAMERCSKKKGMSMMARAGCQGLTVDSIGVWFEVEGGWADDTERSEMSTCRTAEEAAVHGDWRWHARAGTK